MSTYDIRRKAADAIGVLPWATYESPEYMRTLDRVTAALERAYAAGFAAQSAGTAVRAQALREAAVAVAMIMPTVFSESIGGFIRQSLAVEAIERLARAAPPLPPGGAEPGDDIATWGPARIWSKAWDAGRDWAWGHPLDTNTVASEPPVSPDRSRRESR